MNLPIVLPIVLSVVLPIELPIEFLLNCVILREFVLNSRHPDPRREKWGWERRPLRHFGRIRGIRGFIPRGYFLCAGIVKWTHLLGIGRPIFDKSEKIALCTPRHPQGTPRDPQGDPKCRQMRHGFDNMFQTYQTYQPTNLHLYLYLFLVHAQECCACTRNKYKYKGW